MGEIPERFAMNKLFIMLVSMVVMIGCSSPSPCQKTYSKLVKCFPANFDGGDNEKENFMFACQKGDFGECYDDGDCKRVLNCVDLGTKILQLKMSGF